MKRALIIGGAALWSVQVSAVEVARVSFTLPQVIEATINQSPELRAAALKAQAAADMARSERGRMLPTIAVEGSVRRVSEVPELTFPSGQKMKLSDNESYSIGPAAHYTLFHGGADYFAWKAAKAAARSRRMEEQLLRRQQRLAAQLAYFQAQLASEQVRLLLESYKVEEQQHRDIKGQFSAGSAARTDLLSAHQQVLTRQRQLLSARAELAVSLRELTRLTGLAADIDPQMPLSAQSQPPLPANIESPSVLLEIATPDQTLKDLGSLFDSEFDGSQPGIQFFSELAESARLSAKSLQGSRWPELSVLGKISRDYPNGPIHESINQTTVGANLNFPLFTGGELFYGARSKKQEAQAAEQDRDAQARDLLTDWHKAHDQALALRAQQPLYDTTIEEAQELARLQYQSYRAGRARYLDVEDANLKVLQAKTEAARADVRLLVQLATLESLSDNSK